MIGARATTAGSDGETRDDESLVGCKARGADGILTYLRTEGAEKSRREFGNVVIPGRCEASNRNLEITGMVLAEHPGMTDS